MHVAPEKIPGSVVGQRAGKDEVATIQTVIEKIGNGSQQKEISAGGSAVGKPGQLFVQDSKTFVENGVLRSRSGGEGAVSRYLLIVDDEMKFKFGNETYNV